MTEVSQTPGTFSSPGRRHDPLGKTHGIGCSDMRKETRGYGAPLPKCSEDVPENPPEIWPVQTSGGWDPDTLT